MKIYIAGKITGDPNYRVKFESYAERLRSEEHIVLSPAILPDGLSKADYMRICFAMIDVSDMVLFLPDYEDSDGAMIEHDYCEYTGRCMSYAGSEAEVEPEDKKRCYNCFYEGVRFEDDPCCFCKGNEYWKPKEQQKEV